MSHARRARRVLAALACMAVAASAGCRSPLLGFSDVARHGAPEAAAAIDRKGTAEPSPTLAVATPANLLATDPSEASEEPVEVVATPMLDAALRRAEAAEEAQREAVREAWAVVERRAPEPTPAPAPTEIELPPTPAEPAAEPAPAEPAAEPPKVDSDLRPASAEGEEEAATAPPTPPAPTVEPRPVPEPPVVDEVSEAAMSVPETDQEDAPALTIEAVHLCRKISDFGSYEPLKDQTLRPGRSALVYCELNGLEYRPEEDEYVARVATRVELVLPDGGGKVWEVADNAVDRRPARRRDVYVGTMITLPDSIAPGDYTLRLHQADAAAGRAATAELPVTIAR